MSAAPPLLLLTLRADGPLVRQVPGGVRLTRRFTRAGALDLRERRQIAREAQDVMDRAKLVRDAAEPPALGAAGAKRA